MPLPTPPRPAPSKAPPPRAAPPRPAFAESRPQALALERQLRRVPASFSSGPAPPGCHDNESAPRARLLLGRDPGWTAGPGLGEQLLPPPPPRLLHVKALQCALALEIRSVSTGRAPIAAAWVSSAPGIYSGRRLRSLPRTPGHRETFSNPRIIPMEL
ncbi:hypothetical protein J1605_012487 [Eschrichtius robustus]|uniref:Uncharacterized protein n=1 Tax=Eschrichtius robustus TaxID=9764 RepID=A0AB34GKQ4_ESCRO|nr:hypothetical protein J1605_012487 [Eschrichtius robustus]